jgi:hypothetical protein
MILVWTGVCFITTTRSLPKALEKGNHTDAAIKFAKLGKAMNIHVQLLPDAIGDLLIEKTDLSIADVHDIKTSIQNMEDLIIKLR